MAPTPIHVLEVRGDSRARGIQHGQALAVPIRRAVEFYDAFFARHSGLTEDQIRERSRSFFEAAVACNPLLGQEFEGIAEGSRQPLESVIALSARYEIVYGHLRLGECSNVYLGPERTASGCVLLGQNWDWRPEVVAFRAFITARCTDVPDHLTITECGQPGKYGLNEYGIGVAAASLQGRAPIHGGDQLYVTLQRTMLAATTLEDALAVLDRFAPRATVNFLVASADGRGADVECHSSGQTRHALGPADAYWHTNHCRHGDDPTTFADSLARGRRWDQHLTPTTQVTETDVIAWLRDGSAGGDGVFFRRPTENAAATSLMTLASVTMDLGARSMSIADGASGALLTGSLA